MAIKLTAEGEELDDRHKAWFQEAVDHLGQWNSYALGFRFVGDAEVEHFMTLALTEPKHGLTDPVQYAYTMHNAPSLVFAIVDQAGVVWYFYHSTLWNHPMLVATDTPDIGHLLEADHDDKKT